MFYLNIGDRCHIDLEMFDFLNILSNQPIQPVIFLSHVGNLTLNLWRYDGLPMLNGILELFNVIFSLLEIVSNLNNFGIKPVNFLKQNDDPEISFT